MKNNERKMQTKRNHDPLFIPKIIHLTWKNKTIPKEWSHVIDKWKKTHPNWEIHYTTDEDNRAYIEKNHPDFLSIYDQYPYGIQRADAIRYFYLKDMGGVYADLDIEPIKNIEKYLTNTEADALLVYSGNVKVFTNSFMASPKNSPFWDNVIEALKHPKLPWYAFGCHLTVMYSTGPLMLDRVAKEYKRPIALLPQDVFMAYNINNHDEIKPHAALKPLKGGSWNKIDSLVLNFGFKYKYYILLFIIISIAYYIKNKYKLNI
jgi:mannosyltransferase OCH1-like enzyme